MPASAGFFSSGLFGPRRRAGRVIVVGPWGRARGRVRAAAGEGEGGRHAREGPAGLLSLKLLVVCVTMHKTGVPCYKTPVHQSKDNTMAIL
jgi:hypothetical protein